MLGFRATGSFVIIGGVRQSSWPVPSYAHGRQNRPLDSKCPTALTRFCIHGVENAISSANVRKVPMNERGGEYRGIGAEFPLYDRQVFEVCRL